MGYYIQVPQNKNKAKQLIELYDGLEIPQPAGLDHLPDGMSLVVVVDNGPFEAAALAYDEAEFHEFTDPSDHRPKRYIMLDTEDAHLLSGYHKAA